MQTSSAHGNFNKKRLFLKTFAAMVLASSGLGLSGASFAQCAPASAAIGVAAGFPTQAEMLALIGDGHDGSQGSYVWNERAKGLVMVLWPAMDVMARESGQQLSVDLFNRVASLDGMDTFSKTHSGSTEAVNISAYRANLPGFGREENRKMMESNHGYLTMQITHALLTHTAFEAEDIGA